MTGILYFCYIAIFTIKRRRRVSFKNKTLPSDIVFYKQCDGCLSLIRFLSQNKNESVILVIKIRDSVTV